MNTRVSLLLFGLLLAACEEGPAPGPPAVHPPLAPPPAVESPLECSPGASSELYVQRIAPLLRQDRPSSCSGCHLQGIDLAGFVRGSACQSMACLVDRRLVDLDDPASSHVLELIDRGRNKDDDARTRRAASAEYAGFYDWIVFSAACNDAVCPPMEDPCGDGGGTPDALVAPPLRDAAPPDAAPVDAALADADLTDGAADAGPDAAPVVDAAPAPDAGPPPGPCSETALRTLFAEKVWAWEGRCHHCHAGDGLEAGLAGAPTWVAEDDDEEAAIDRTFDRILARSYLDLSAPAESLLLLKPLARRVGGVRHGGGDKFLSLEDPAYLDFLFWVQTYAACAQGQPPPPSAAP